MKQWSPSDIVTWSNRIQHNYTIYTRTKKLVSKRRDAKKLTTRKLKISSKTSIMDHLSLSDVVPITNGNQHFTHRETNWQSDTRKVYNRNSQLESAQSVPKDQSRIRSPNLVSFSMEKPITIESRTATVKLTPTGTANKNTSKKLSQTKKSNMDEMSISGIKVNLQSWQPHWNNQLWISCAYQVPTFQW